MFPYKQKFILLLLQLLICIIFVESTETNEIIDNCYSDEIVDTDLNEGVFKGPPVPRCSSNNCNWNIQPKENTFIYIKLKAIKTIDNYDTLDVYQTRWNGSELIKIKHANLSYDMERYRHGALPMEHYRFASSVNGGFFFNLSTHCNRYGRFLDKNSNHRFEISFYRRSEDKFC
uniref:CUB domain-containing protein n=1 Tax=Meloidogyne floridensis TaxID=298350 RepID=A0A915NI15_9BILA